MNTFKIKKSLKERFVFVLAIVVSGLFYSVQSMADATYYLVRHGEKQIDGTDDPELTPRGELRAKYLAQQLAKANITKIYSSDYKRTLSTAKPLADLLGLTVESYDPRDLEKFSTTLLGEVGQILIVGHSNTTPNLVALLSGSEVDPIDDAEYENLYQIVLVDGKAILSRFRIFPLDDAIDESLDKVDESLDKIIESTVDS